MLTPITELTDPFTNPTTQKHSIAQLHASKEKPSYTHSDGMIVSGFELEYMASLLEDFYDHTSLDDRIKYSRLRTRLISFMGAARHPKLDFIW